MTPSPSSLVRRLPPLPLRDADPSQRPASDPAPDETVLLHLRGVFRVHLKDLPMDHPAPRMMRTGQLDLLRRHVPSLSASTTDPTDLGKALHGILTPLSMGSDSESFAARMLDQELLVMWLLNRGAVPTVEDLGLAASNGNVRLVQRVLEALPEHERDRARATTPCPIDRDDDPVYALAVGSSWSSAPRILDLLLAVGAPLDRCDASYGRTALHWAVLNNRQDAVHALLERGADPNQADHAGHTPVHVAAWSNHEEVLDLLVLAGGDVHRNAVPNDQPVPPAYGAPQMRRLGTPLPHEVIPNPDPVPVDGSTARPTAPTLQDTPLLQAADNGASKTLQRLLDLGVDPFPLQHPGDSTSPRDRRALGLALENETFQQRGTSSFAKTQARLTVQRLEQAWETQALRATFEEHSPDLGSQSRPRL